MIDVVIMAIHASLSTDVLYVLGYNCLKKAYIHVYTHSHNTSNSIALGDSSIAAVSKFDAAFKRYLKSRLKEEELTRDLAGVSS